MDSLNPIYEPALYGVSAFVGLVSCFMGHRLFKALVVVLVALAGAAGMAWLGYNFGNQPLLWSIGGLIGGLLLGAALALFFYRLAVSAIAALFVALAISPWVQDFAVPVQMLALGGACLVAALIANAVTNLMIQLASAMVGSFLLIHGLLYFITGETLHRTVEGENGTSLDILLDPMTACLVVGLGLVGYLVQRRRAAA